jgi:hypothetical protein
LRECKRPAFAENKSTLYNKPVGDGIEGLGIRFVEVALRHMRNIEVDATTTYDDTEREIVHVSLTDLESNVPFGQDVTIRKTVERSKPLDDGSYIAVRTNSRGRKVYTVQATDEDMLNKRGALISKAIRTLGLRLIPGDIQDEAEELIRQIRTAKAAADPGAERKRIVDAFGEIGVRADDLKAFLGHDIGQCSPPELVKLRGFYGAIRDGQTTWREIIESVGGSASDAPPPPESRLAAINREVTTEHEPAPRPNPPPPAAAQPAQASMVEPPTYREIANGMNQATDGDTIDLAESVVDGAIADPMQRAELHDLARVRRVELGLNPRG